MTDVAILKSKLQDHIKASDKEFIAMSLSIKDLKRVVDNIKDNHLEHIQQDIGDLRTKSAVNAEKLERVMKVQWYMITTLIGNLIGVIYLIINRI